MANRDRSGQSFADETFIHKLRVAAERHPPLKPRSTIPAHDPKSSPRTAPLGRNSHSIRIAIAAATVLFAAGGVFVLKRSSNHNARYEGNESGRKPADWAARDIATEESPHKAAQAPTPAFEPHVQDRTITKEQNEKFVEVLRNTVRGKVIVSALKGDREGYLYAAKLASMLHQAGFAEDDSPVTFLSETEVPRKPSVWLYVSGEVPVRPHALAIKDALEVIGIHCEFAYRETPGRRGDLQIAVYPKP